MWELEEVEDVGIRSILLLFIYFGCCVVGYVVESRRRLCFFFFVVRLRCSPSDKKRSFILSEKWVRDIAWGWLGLVEGLACVDMKDWHEGLACMDSGSVESVTFKF